MKYQIRGYSSLRDSCGYDAEREADTLKEALHQAKYMISDQYRIASEADATLVLVQIWKGDVLIDEVRS